MGISSGIASIFGIIIRVIYNLFGENYGLSIIIFTVITKIILFPISYKQSKAMENMKKIAPLEKEIREKYKGNKEKTAEEITKMYQQNKINPMGGCLPLLIQLPIIIAMFYIVKQPLTYIKQMSPDNISIYMEDYTQINGKTVYREDYTESHIKNQEIQIAKENNFINMKFIGINFGDTPSHIFSSEVPNNEKPSKIILLIPMLSLLFALIQNKIAQKNNKLTEEQQQQQKTMSVMLPVLSAYISYIMPVALGIYWLFGSVLQIITQLIIDKMIKNKNKILLKEGEENK